jgi:hypothetical protein
MVLHLFDINVVVFEIFSTVIVVLVFIVAGNIKGQLLLGGWQMEPLFAEQVLQNAN